MTTTPAVYPFVGVKGGKFHQPVTPTLPETHRPWRDALDMKCGRSLIPTNYFVSREDALAYCGNRAQYLCGQCDK